MLKQAFMQGAQAAAAVASEAKGKKHSTVNFNETAPSSVL